ncbi:MAG: ribosome biogenesis GTPase YlqF [Lachnospiraceae bacterium]|nr:ribosome biogenesis GTPase YlqF [Lachnospiraceae bacterium]
MAYNWYPGHMTRAKREMESDLKLIDLIIELLDARAPMSTRNPDIDAMGAGKGRLVLLNKADLADEAENRKWIQYFEEKGFTALALDSRNNKGMKAIDTSVQVACQEKIERNRKKGILNRPMRAMVVGIPNVGKSTFINSYARRAVAKTGNKPGVTKGKQWVRLGKNLELLDTPGILWPKIESDEAGFHLAVIGSMNDEVLNREDLLERFLKDMQIRYPSALLDNYGISPEMSFREALEAAAEKRNALKPGGLPDTDRAVRFILDDFRGGRLGRITLDICEI